MEKNLTTGSVFKNLVVFSLPYLLSFCLQTLYGMADLFIIGQYAGVAATTAVSVGSQVMHMLTVMIVGLAMGTTVSIGQAVGAGDRRRAAQDVGNTVTLFMALSLVLTAALLLLVRPIVTVMSTPAEAVEGAVRYLTICFIGIPFITAYNILSSIFRGMGGQQKPHVFHRHRLRGKYRAGLSVHGRDAARSRGRRARYDAGAGGQRDRLAGGHRQKAYAAAGEA